MEKQFGFVRLNSRYRALIVFIALFVFSIVSVLVLNFYISSQFNEDALEINIAGRQRMLSQRIVKALLDVQTAEQSGASIDKPLTELKTSAELFDSTLVAFDIGGKAIDTSGNEAFIDAVESVKSRNAVDAAQRIWSDYREKIFELVGPQADNLKTIANVNELVSAHNEDLLLEMNTLTELLQDSGAEGGLINLAGRQRLLSQQLAKDLFQLGISRSDDDVERLFEDLEKTVNSFDSTLKAFASGGRVIEADGKSYLIEALSDTKYKETLNRTLDVWKPLRAKFNELFEIDRASLVGLSNTVSFALSKNIVLLNTMNDLTTNLQAESERRSGVMRIIQIIGIAISLLMFAIILFYFLRQLRNSDDELEDAKAETDRIMDTVNNGLFLLDNEYNVGSQHSSSIVNILDQDDFGGANFLKILKKIVPKETLKITEDYLALLFGDRVYEELIADLNPLNALEVHIDTKDGRHETKFLEFGFKRVLINDEVSHLLVQVDDITKQVTLEKELEDSQEKAQRELDLMLNVLHVEPQALAEFLNGSETSLREINDVLSDRSNASRSREKVDQIFRSMHSIKGDASALELEVFADKAHEFESELEKLRQTNKVEGADFLPLTILLDSFLTQIESLRAMIERMDSLRTAVQGAETSSELVTETADANKLITNKLKKFTQRLAEKRGKIATFSLLGEEKLPEVYRRDVDEVLTQLVRNSLVHGIEEPKARSKARKPIQGSIRASIQKTQNNNVELRFHDDGKGLSPQKIKESAIEKGLITSEKAEQLNDKQLAALTLKSGFSSLDDVDQDAGRGVGMDVIRSRILKLGGDLKIRYSEGKSYEFIANLPLLSTDNSEIN